MNFIQISGYVGEINLKFVNGEIIGPFYSIKMLDKDFIAVQKNKDSKWTIFDKYGEEKGSFWDVKSFDSGHFVVQKEGNIQYLDLIGRLYSTPTQSGMDFYSYYKREIPYTDLDKQHFNDPKFLHAVIVEELDRAIMYDPQKYSDRTNRSQKQLELSEEISDWVYHNNATHNL